jgi:hypothetical protein
MSGSQLRVFLLRFTLSVSFGFIVLLVMGFIFFPSGDESVDDPIGWANRLQTYFLTGLRRYTSSSSSYSLCFSLALVIRRVLGYVS